jgi:nitrogen fixation/metabolism regulation signal transduction histidine kinase
MCCCVPCMTDALFSTLRSRLAARLAPQLQHELRNPLNALSLHSDLLLRMTSTLEPALAARMSNSLKAIKTRIADLQQRQDDYVTLWLARPEGLARCRLAETLTAAQAVLRPLLAHQEITLDWSSIEACRDLTIALDRSALHLLLVGLVTAAVEDAHDDGLAAVEWQVKATPAQGGEPARLWLRLPARHTAAANPLSTELTNWIAQEQPTITRAPEGFGLPVVAA